jgi:hypothetical protein
MYENLTALLDDINAPIGERIIDTENDGSTEHTKQFPFVHYSEFVHKFIDVVYGFERMHPETALNRYNEILEYSCAMKSHFRKSGNQKTGRRKSSYASLFA